jgi:hypothetical protein
LWVVTGVADQHAASQFSSQNRGNTLLQNVGDHLQDYMMLQSQTPKYIVDFW